MSGGANLPLIEVAGTAFERGQGIGAQLGERIRDFLGQDLARINRIRPQPVSHATALRYVARVAPIVEAELPEVAQAVRGLAAGARISYADAMLLQFRRELISVGEDDCTTIAGLRAGQAFIAQNVDLPGALEDLGIVVRERPSEPGEPDVLMVTHVGLLGYLGLNSAGLGVGINMVLSDDWRPGVSPYLLVRQLLRQRTLGAALDEIGRVPRASSRCFFITDGTRIVDVEMTAREHAVAEAAFHLHTNHYVIPEMARHDRYPAGGTSRPRFERASALLGDRTDLGPDRLAGVLSDHERHPLSICAHQAGALNRTIASVMLFPSEGRLLASMGPPCSNDYHPYHLARRPAAQEAST